MQAVRVVVAYQQLGEMVVGDIGEFLAVELGDDELGFGKPC